jgi:hypothetical protein
MTFYSELKYVSTCNSSLTHSGNANAHKHSIVEPQDIKSVALVYGTTQVCFVVSTFFVPST